MINWLLEHTWIAVVIAGLAVRMITSVSRAAKSARPPVPPTRRREFVEAELAEKNRQIREEIRRKIEERRGQGAPARAPSAQPPLRSEERSPEATTPPPVLRMPSLKEARMRREPPPVPAPVETSVEIARQAALLENLRATTARKEAAEKRAAAKEAAMVAAGVTQSPVAAAMQADLRDPDLIRRAFLWREILGPPVALR